MGRLSFLPEFECLFQCNLQHAGAVDIFDFVSDKSDNLRMIEPLSAKAPIKIHELPLAERVREHLTVDFTVREGHRTYPTVTCEKVSSITLSWVVLLLMSSKAMSLSGRISSFNSLVRQRRKNSPSEVATPNLPRRIYSLGSRAGEPSLPYFCGCNPRECQHLEI